MKWCVYGEWAYIVNVKLTVFLNSLHSSGVRVSALAMRGMILTLSCSRFINSTSNGFNLIQHSNTNNSMHPYLRKSFHGLFVYPLKIYLPDMTRLSWPHFFHINIFTTRINNLTWSPFKQQSLNLILLGRDYQQVLNWKDTGLIRLEITATTAESCMHLWL